MDTRAKTAPAGRTVKVRFQPDAEGDDVLRTFLQTLFIVFVFAMFINRSAWAYGKYDMLIYYPQQFFRLWAGGMVSATIIYLIIMGLYNIVQMKELDFIKFILLVIVYFLVTSIGLSANCILTKGFLVIDLLSIGTGVFVVILIDKVLKSRDHVRKASLIISVGISLIMVILK